MNRRKLTRVIRWISIAAISVAAVFFVRRLDPERALDVLATTNVWWVLAAMVVNASLRCGTRVLRTRSLLFVLPGAVPLRQLAKFVYGSMALGYIMSPVAGSAARVFALQHHGVPTEAVVAVGLWEKVVTGVTIATFSGVMLLRDTPASVADLRADRAVRLRLQAVEYVRRDAHPLRTPCAAVGSRAGAPRVGRRG